MLQFLKGLPLSYKGELHNIKLINFAVPLEEVMPYIPLGITPRVINGKALISLVDVRLKKMRCTLLPCLRFSYRHVAFRLLVEDPSEDTQSRSIYFLRSFTPNPVIAFGGSIFTNYRLEHAKIQSCNNNTRIVKNRHYVEYELSSKEPKLRLQWLKYIIGRIDQACFISAGDVYKIQIQRESWPIEWIDCNDFSTNLFSSTEVLGAFQVLPVIHYTWQKPVRQI